MFDRLLLLEEGRVAYNGPVEDIVAYFKDCGYECPMYHNPADFVFEAMAIEKKGPGSFAEKWKNKLKKEAESKKKVFFFLLLLLLLGMRMDLLQLKDLC